MMLVSHRSLWLSRLYCWLGIQHIVERHATGGAILLYHSVVDKVDIETDPYGLDAATFDRHLRFFKNECEVVPLRDVIDAVKLGQHVANRWVAISFDDGIRCQVDIAARMLREHGLPWSLSVPAGLVGTGRSIWTNELRFLIHCLWSERELPLPDGMGELVAVASRPQKQHAVRSILSFLHSNSNVCDPVRYVDTLVNHIGHDRFCKALANDGRFPVVSWDEIRALRTEGVEILSHGDLHRSHSWELEESELTSEIVGSRRCIEAGLGTPPSGFALPFGRHSGNTLHLIERAGYGYCLTSERGRVFSGGNRFRLPRFDADCPLPVLRRHMTMKGK